ncbi:MAG: TIGR03668 family PPOX class F420-dependent oxidoreductase [Gammaproteobacteria bacterium]
MFSADLVERILDTAPVARLAQKDLSGQPQALPFVFTRVERCLWSPIDGKPKKRANLSRLEWIAAQPQVLVLVDHYEDDWAQLWWLKLSGRATVVREREPGWHAAVAGLTAKYPQYGETPMFASVPTMVRIDIADWKAWASSGEAALRRRYFPEAPDVAG